MEKTKLYDQKLSNTQKSHAAVYFCAYWDTSSGHSENMYSHPVHELIYKIFIAHTVICDFWLSNVSHICYEHLNKCEDIHEIFVMLWLWFSNLYKCLISVISSDFMKSLLDITVVLVWYIGNSTVSWLSLNLYIWTMWKAQRHDRHTTNIWSIWSHEWT